MNTTPILYDMSGFNGICELNQAKLLEATEKIPSTGYYILLIGLASLLFYFFIQPRLKKEVQEGLSYYIGWLGTCLVFLACWVLALGVFRIGEAELQLFTRLTSFLLLPLLLLLGHVVYKKYFGGK